MSNMNINKRLQKIQKEWYDSNFKRMLGFKDEIFSNPFFYAEPENISNPKVMIIGQEPANFNSYRDEIDIPIEKQWTVDYLERQAYSVANGISYNQSPFWDLFRLLASNGMYPTWNNLDKVHRLMKGPNGITTEPLRLENECVLNAPQESNGKTLLQNEIEISQPDKIVFVTGPDYWISMSTAMQCDAEKLKSNQPSKKNTIIDISNIVNVGVQCLWTYHPKFLRISGNNDCIKKVADMLK